MPIDQGVIDSNQFSLGFAQVDFYPRLVEFASEALSYCCRQAGTLLSDKIHLRSADQVYEDLAKMSAGILPPSFMVDTNKDDSQD